MYERLDWVGEGVYRQKEDGEVEVRDGTGFGFERAEAEYVGEINRN